MAATQAVRRIRLRMRSDVRLKDGEDVVRIDEGAKRADDFNANDGVWGRWVQSLDDCVY